MLGNGSQVSELKQHEPDCQVWVCQTRSDMVGDGDTSSGNKGVVKREVTHQAAQEFADSIDAPLVVTSAKQGTGIQVLFQYLILLIVKP